MKNFTLTFGKKGNSNGNYKQAEFQSGKIHCPVCNEYGDYKCSVTEDDGLCLCSNVPSDRFARDGRYIHILKNGSPKPDQKAAKSVESQENPRAEIAPADIIQNYRQVQMFFSHTNPPLKHRHHLSTYDRFKSNKNINVCMPKQVYT